MAKKIQSNLFVGSIISSLIAAMLLLLEDFAGWYNYSSYAEIWGWVGFSLNRPVSLLVFGAAAVILFFCTYVSYLKLSSKPVPVGWVKKAFYGSAGVTALSVIGGVYFIVDMMITDPTDWWLGPAFYAGIIGGGLTALFFHLALNETKR